MTYQETFTISTPGRGIYPLSDLIQKKVGDSNIHCGICHVFLRHTSASLILCENTDPQVQKDIETFLSAWVKDGDPRYTHVEEGPDDMAAHLRNLLTSSDLTIPITEGKLHLGRWQGIYLYEHRFSPMERSITVTVLGE